MAKSSRAKSKSKAKSAPTQNVPSPCTPARRARPGAASSTPRSSSTRHNEKTAELEALENEIRHQQRGRQKLQKFSAATGNNNTASCYAAPQRRFKAYCEQEGLNSIVDTQKLSLFLVQEATRLKKDGKMVGPASITNAKSAIMKLYDDQVEAGGNNNARPDKKDAWLGRAMEGIARQTQGRDVVTFRDKAKGSIIESIVSPNDLVNLQRAFLPLPGSAAASRPQFFSAHLGHRFAFCTSFSAALRCESTRLLSLSDMASIHFDDEGARGADILVWSLNEGKTNQFGKVDRTAIMRHVDVEMCGQGAAAMVLFERFHVRNEKFPTFEKNIEWWHHKLLQPATTGRSRNQKLSWVERKLAGLEDEGSESEDEDEDMGESGSDSGSGSESGDESGDDTARRRKRVRQSRAARKRVREEPIEYGPLVGDGAGVADSERADMARRLKDMADALRQQPGIEPISYQTQRKAFKVATERAGVQSSRVTHIGRASAASIVAHFGKDLDSEMRRHGHWNKDAMSNCYTEGFPMGAVRILAGFNCYSTKQQYHINRDILTPSDYLLSLIFPGLDDAITLHNDPNSNVEHSVTARATLRALKYLRKVFLQDSVFLREKEGWSHLSALWGHPIFSDPEYLLFAENLKQACSTPEAINPSSTHIDPFLREYIDGHFRTFHDDLIIVNHTMATSMASKEDVAMVHRELVTMSRNQDAIIRAWNGGTVPRIFIPERTAVGVLASPLSARASGSGAGTASGLESLELGTGPHVSSSSPALATNTNIETAAERTSSPQASPSRANPINAGTVPTFRTISAIPSSSSAAQVPLDDLPAYFGMLKTTRTVGELWREWTEPYFVPLRPSVQQMDSRYGKNKWTDDKKVPGARKWYRRRDSIITFITTQPEYSAEDPTGAVKAVSAMMKEEGWSMDQLGKHCSSVIAKAKQTKGKEV